jgi:hypothetical protein
MYTVTRATGRYCDSMFVSSTCPRTVAHSFEKMSQASSGDKNRTTIVKNHEMVPNEADSRVETDNTSRVYDFAGPLPLLVPQVEKSTHEWRAHRYFGAKFQDYEF